MVMNTSCTAIRTDRGLTAAHGGARLASRSWITASNGASTVANGVTTVAPKAAFVGVPTYVGQESHPPRGSSPV